MGLTSAMLVGVTGIRSNQFLMDSIGDNVANVNTTAFKSQRALFETMFYRTLQEGTAPSENQGGTNPLQIGYGSNLGSIQRLFGQGSLEATGMKSDLAIEGDGFFIVNNVAGEQVFTRDGSFRLNRDNALVTADGGFVQGFAADSDGTIIEGTLTNLLVPVGIARAAVPTAIATFDGNLDASSAQATAGAVVTSAPLVTAGGQPASGSTALTALVDPLDVPLFADGDTVVISGWQKGGVDLPDAQFVVGADVSTVDELAAFLQEHAGINTDPATGGTPGVTISAGPDPAPGSMVISSNFGEANAVSLDASAIRNATTGVLPFQFTATPAVGEGATTSFLVFDSLGNPVEVRLRLALESKSSSGNVWRFYAESPDDSDADLVTGTGTITFDQNGQFVSATGTSIQVDREGVGSATPLTFDLDFAALTGLASPDDGSTLALATQDGRPAGELIDFAVERDGTIVGSFSNAETQVLGQVALARFRNPGGLVAREGNTYMTGANSGEPLIVAPETGGAGSIQSGSLELSNVELTREFLGLINASTGFSAASRVVRTADDMLQELLLLAR